MNWLQRLLRSARMEKDLDKELRFHFDEMVEARMAEGMKKDEAQRVTRLEFGGMDQVKEDCRESRGTMIASIGQDVRFGAAAGAVSRICFDGDCGAGAWHRCEHQLSASITS